MITINEYLSTKVKQSNIKANDNTIKEIVLTEIKRLGKDCDLNHIDVGEVTDFTKVFYLKDFSGDVSLWNVSNGTNFTLCFAGNSSFNCDLTAWNVKNSECFSRMFALDREFRGIGLENWIVDSCLYFDKMFASCNSFNGNISGWKISPEAKTFESMFKECESFTQDLSKWKISKYSNKMDMFWHCPLARRKNSKPQEI